MNKAAESITLRVGAAEMPAVIACRHIQVLTVPVYRLNICYLSTKQLQILCNVS
jgi:hypothetical protein